MRVVLILRCKVKAVFIVERSITCV
jgi:hypothetical protein